MNSEDLRSLGQQVRTETEEFLNENFDNPTIGRPVLPRSDGSGREIDAVLSSVENGPATTDGVLSTVTGPCMPPSEKELPSGAAMLGDIVADQELVPQEVELSRV